MSSVRYSGFGVSCPKEDLCPVAALGFTVRYKVVAASGQFSLLFRMGSAFFH